MNSEDIYSSLRGVTEAIQNFSFRSQEDMSEPLKRDPKKEDADTVSVYMFIPSVSTFLTHHFPPTSVLTWSPHLLPHS